jgi:hypothetical protein
MYWKVEFFSVRYLGTGLIDAHANPKCTVCVVTGLLDRYEWWFHFFSLSLTGGFLADNIVLSYVRGTHHKNEMIVCIIICQKLIKWVSNAVKTIFRSMTFHYGGKCRKTLVSSVQSINETNSIKIKTKSGMLSTLDFIFINNVPTTSLLSL